MPANSAATSSCWRANVRIKEIEKIQARADPAIGSPPLPLEVFVHGALCVAYSGQCLTSEALGGRSANRGECAQACRMPYELISDGKQVPLGDKRYLLSPQDLAGLEVLPELVRAGVASLKIEGRLEDARICREHHAGLSRRRLDAATRGRRFATQVAAETNRDTIWRWLFRAGFTPAGFGGINNQELVHARFGKKRGVFLGEVEPRPWRTASR